MAVVQGESVYLDGSSKSGEPATAAWKSRREPAECALPVAEVGCECRGIQVETGIPALIPDERWMAVLGRLGLKSISVGAPTGVVQGT
jgi:hypothetical protein